MSIPVVMAWSGGKDAAMALWTLQQDPQYEVVALLTTITEKYRRVVMQGIRESVLEAQADRIGLPLRKVWLSGLPSNDEYENAMGEALGEFRSEGVRHVAHGDLFLEDVRNYREQQLAKLDMQGVYPIWERGTGKMARWFMQQGFRATLSCIDGEQLDAGFAGREFDAALLADLPDTVDPCGENGEFHSCVTAGPIFTEPLETVTGERVTRLERFHYCDILLATEA